MAYLIPNVHCLCSGLPETREVNFSLHWAETGASTTSRRWGRHSIIVPSCLTGNYRVCMDLEGLDTQPSLSHRETYRQQELTGL